MAAASCIASAMIWSRRVRRVALGVARDPRRLQLGFGEHGARFGLRGGALLERGVGGVEPTLLEGAGDLGVGLGADQRGLVGGGRERTLADLRGGGFRGDELELRGEPRLAQGGDRLAPEPLDLLLRASAPGRASWRRTAALTSWRQGYGTRRRQARIAGQILRRWTSQALGRMLPPQHGTGRRSAAVKVPLTILDHLERAELVYGARGAAWSTSPTSPRRRGRR